MVGYNENDCNALQCKGMMMMTKIPSILFSICALLILERRLVMLEGSRSAWLSRDPARVGAVRLVRSGRHSKQRWQAQKS